MKYLLPRHLVAIILFLSLSLYAIVLWATEGLTKLGPLESVIGQVDEAQAYLTLTHPDVATPTKTEGNKSEAAK